MKLLLVLVSAIAIFTADSRDFPDKPDRSDTFDNDDLPPWTDGQTSATHEEYFTNDSADSTDEDQKPMYESMQLDDEPTFTYMSELDEQITKEGNMRMEGKLRGSSCSSSVICSILGGSCISKAIHCGGWLVAEGCNGTNCKCCIPGSLEIKTSNIGVELQSLKNDLARLKDLPSAIENITNTDSVLRQELENITNVNSELKIELESMKNNLKNSTTNLDSKLDYVIKKQGCSNVDGLFWSSSTNECFKYLKDKSRNWNDAKTQCGLEGLQLAEPADPIALTKQMVKKYYGISVHVWIGGKGTGSAFKWQVSGQSISNSDSKWYSGRPGSYYSTSYCLNLLVTTGSASNGRVYYNEGCSTGRYTLCELVM